jgi:hypothetical protein
MRHRLLPSESHPSTSTLFVSGFYSLSAGELSMALACVRAICNMGARMNALGQLVCSFSADREVELLSLLGTFSSLSWVFAPAEFRERATA